MPSTSPLLQCRAYYKSITLSQSVLAHETGVCDACHRVLEGVNEYARQRPELLPVQVKRVMAALEPIPR